MTTQRVFLHIGAPLTGTTYLRECLARHRRRLARYGVLYPPSHLGHDGGHVDAVLDVLGLAATDHAPSTGAWDRLAETVRDWRRGTVVISHELLADASEPQIERILASFGNLEVHVVYAARDLARQIPIAWQEWVRNGGTATFLGYANRVATREEHRVSNVFWRSHAVDEVLGRWAGHVPVDRIHLLTVPNDRDQDAVLWDRFATLVGLNPRRFKPGADRGRRLLGVAQNEVLRLLNTDEQYAADPRRAARLRQALESQGGAAAAVPAAHAERLRAQADAVLTAVKSAGYQVVGDITDLMPEPDEFAEAAERTTAADRDVISAQSRALAALTDKPRGPAGLRRRTLRVPKVWSKPRR